MAFIFTDSFDHYSTADIAQKWTTATFSMDLTSGINAAAGRRSTSALRLATNAGGGWNAILRKTLTTSGAGFVVGFYMKCTSTPTASGIWLCALADAGIAQVALRLNSDFTISVIRGGPTFVESGGAVLATSGATGLSTAVGGYIEFKGTIDNATGTYALKVNGNVMTLTGSGSADTQATGSSTWNAFWIGAIATNGFISQFNTPGTLDFDDLYVLDQSGGSYDDFLGDVRVDYLKPTGVGATSNGTPTSGANYANVDEVSPDGDTTIVTLAAAGDLDTYQMEDAPLVGGSILAVQSVISVKKADSGTCTVAPVFRHSGTNYPGTAVGPATVYGYLLEMFVNNPGTSAAWVEADFNAIEAGPKKVA